MKTKETAFNNFKTASVFDSESVDSASKAFKSEFDPFQAPQRRGIGGIKSLYSALVESINHVMK